MGNIYQWIPPYEGPDNLCNLHASGNKTCRVVGVESSVCASVVSLFFRLSETNSILSAFLQLASDFNSTNNMRGCEVIYILRVWFSEPPLKQTLTPRDENHPNPLSLCVYIYSLSIHNRFAATEASLFIIIFYAGDIDTRSFQPSGVYNSLRVRCLHRTYNGWLPVASELYV